MHIARSCWASHQLTPPSCSSQGCSWSILCPVCVYAWDCPNPRAAHCTRWCWTSWGLHRPISSLSNGSPVFLQIGLTFSLVFLLSLMYLKKHFCCLWCPWPDLVLPGHVSFPNMIPACSDNLYSSQATCSCFHPLQASFLCFSLSRSVLFLCTGIPWPLKAVPVHPAKGGKKTESALQVLQCPGQAC